MFPVFMELLLFQGLRTKVALLRGAPVLFCFLPCSLFRAPLDVTSPREIVEIFKVCG